MKGDIRMKNRFFYAASKGDGVLIGPMRDEREDAYMDIYEHEKEERALGTYTPNQYMVAEIDAVKRLKGIFEKIYDVAIIDCDEKAMSNSVEFKRTMYMDGYAIGISLARVDERGRIKQGETYYKNVYIDASDEDVNHIIKEITMFVERVEDDAE